jgi:hypothetical protein
MPVLFVTMSCHERSFLGPAGAEKNRMSVILIAKLIPRGACPQTGQNVLSLLAIANTETVCRKTAHGSLSILHSFMID